MATAATESYVDDHDMGWRGSSPLTGMEPDVSERRGPGSRRTKLMPDPQPDVVQMTDQSRHGRRGGTARIRDEYPLCRWWALRRRDSTLVETP